MLSSIGLALDFVGALALIFGLFSYSEPLTPGWLRDPEESAHDAAFGLVGGLFLAAGFVLQSLNYLGVHWPSSHRRNLAGALLALGLGGVVAYVLYGLAFVALFGRDLRRPAREYGEHGAPYTSEWRRKRRGVRWWRQELVRQPLDQWSQPEGSGGAGTA